MSQVQPAEVKRGGFVGDRRDWTARATHGDPSISLDELDRKALRARTLVMRAQGMHERGLGEGPSEEQVREAQALAAQVATILTMRKRRFH